MEKVDQRYTIRFFENKTNNNIVARAMFRNLIYYIKVYSEVTQEFKDRIYSIEVPKRTGKIHKKVIDYVTTKDFNKLFNACHHERLRLMVGITFKLGLRSQELRNLKWCDIDNENDKIKVIKGKNNKDRNLPMDSNIKLGLAEYKNYINPEDDTSRIFKMSAVHWWRELKKLSEKAIGRRIHPHTLRHSSATYLAKKNLTLQEIRDFLGHEHIKTTDLYVHLDTSNLDSKIKQAWANKTEDNKD